jgi:biotin carboxyl carrier protein
MLRREELLMSANFCPKCGEKTVSSFRFCPACGADLSIVADATKAAERQAENRAVAKAVGGPTRMEVRAPSPGGDFEEVEIVGWYKESGEYVERGEPLYEMETDKVTVDVTSDHAGVLVARLARVNETVAVGALVAVIDTVAEVGTRLPEDVGSWW